MEPFQFNGSPNLLRLRPFEGTGLVRAAFTTRRGGVSPAPYESLNMGMGSGDTPENVAENRRRALAEFGGEGPLCRVRQVHGARIRSVQAGWRELPRTVDGEAVDLGEGDGLVTDLPGPVLSVLTADCIPVYLLDPVRRVAALLHAGWRGTLAGIGPRAVELMTREYGSRPENCLAAIGPGIGPCCFEVDEPVLDAVAAVFPGEEERLGLFRPTRPGHATLDLWEANARLLAGVGFRREAIHVTGLCTRCRPDLFYSHRGEGPRTGRMAALLEILP